MIFFLLFFLLWTASALTTSPPMPSIFLLFHHPHHLSNYRYHFFQRWFCDKSSLRACLDELREQSDSSPDNRYADVFIQLRHHLNIDYPELLTKDDREFQSSVSGMGKTFGELQELLSETKYKVHLYLVNDVFVVEIRCLSVCLCVCWSVCLSVCMSVCMFVCFSDLSCFFFYDKSFVLLYKFVSNSDFTPHPTHPKIFTIPF